MNLSQIYDFYGLISSFTNRTLRGEIDVLSGVFLATLANARDVSSDYLMDGTIDDLVNSLLTDKELLNHFKMIKKMTEEKKSVVKIFLDAFITKDKIKQLAL